MTSFLQTPQALAFLDSLLAHGPVGYGFVNTALCFEAVNDRLAEMNGLPAAAHLGRSVQEVLGPELWETRRGLFERALAGRESVDLPLPGRDRSLRVSYYPVRMDNQISGVAVIVRDVTARTRAEEALAVREQEYRLVFDANPQPMWVYDLATLRFLAVNDAAVAGYGYSREEFLSMTIADIRPPEDVALMTTSVQTPRSGAWRDGPWQHLRHTGAAFWVEITATDLDFRGCPARLVLARDVTDRLALEEERRESARQEQRFLRDVLVSVTEGKLWLCAEESDLPLPGATQSEAVDLTPDAGLYALRRLAEGFAGEAGHSALRQHDLMTAASEAGMNAIVHAGGGTAQVSVDEHGTVQVRVVDHGTGITLENLPRAALARGFSTKATFGHGLKMILETVDLVFLLTGPTGTTLVLEQEKVAPAPDWL